MWRRAFALARTPRAEGQREVALDVAARRVARLARLDEPDPGADQQRLDGGDAHVERLGEVRVAQALELAHEQGGALLLGQALDVGDEAPEVVAALGLGERVGHDRAADVEDVGRRGDRAAELVDAAVVGHAVEPGLQRDGPVVDAQGVVGAQEDVLEGVLGVGARAREHLADVGEEPLAVAVVDDAERLVVARPEERDELLVAAQLEQGRRQRETAEASRCAKC